MLDSPTVVACFDDVAVMCYSIQQCGRHFLVAKDRWSFTEGQVGGDDDRGALIKMREQVENELAAIL